MKSPSGEYVNAKSETLGVVFSSSIKAIMLTPRAVEAIRRIDGKPYDLIITDYRMPKMDGLELTRRIRTKYPSTPVLIITGDGPVRDLLKSGATACLRKPFNLLKLRNIAERLLNKG